MNTKDWIIAVLVVLLILLGSVGAYYYNKAAKSDGEIILINDSLTTYKNKYNEEYTAKNTYILKAEQLSQYNQALYAEYKSLKDNPVVIVKPQIVYKVDTVYTKTDSSISDSTSISWNWSAADSTFYRIQGESHAAYDKTQIWTVINSILIDAGVTVDIVDDGEQLKALVKSDNPYVTIPEMSSVIIDPEKSPSLKKHFKQKKWGIGPYVGIGVNVGYDPFAKNVGMNLGVSGGIAISYHLFEW